MSVFENYTHDPRDPAGRHEWTMTDVDLAIANALRRVMLTDITNMGFRGEEATGVPSVDIQHNTGPLHNEIISHRVGMLPVHFTAAEIAEGPDAWRFDLDVSAPHGQKVNVTTHDFKIFKNDEPLPHSETTRLFPADKITGSPVLITRLRENERLAFTALPVLSTAREHAGFSPVSLCTYQFVVDPEVAATAANVLDKERSYFKNRRGDPTRIQFSLESEVALTPKQIMEKAFDVLLGKIERVRAAINNEEIDVGFLTTRQPQNGMTGFEFVFKNEDDTLGNLLQSLIYNETIRKGGKQPIPALSYVGYCCPHPLDPTMVLRLVIDDGNNENKEEEQAAAIATPDAYKTIFRTHVDRIHGVLTGLKAAWMDFAPK